MDDLGDKGVILIWELLNKGDSSIHTMHVVKTKPSFYIQKVPGRLSS